MFEINYLAFFKESFTLVILLFCSVLSITVTLERWWAFRKARRQKTDDFLERVGKMIEEDKLDRAGEILAATDSPMTRIFRYAMTHRKKGHAELGELLLSKRQEERIHLERFLGVLGTLGNTAPFIGLFGTVVGIIKAFQALALSGTGGPSVVAKGIAEALVATAAGLAVAIPAVILYNYFMRRLKVIMSELEIFSTRLVIMLESK